MSTPNPFPFLDDAFQKLATTFQPPAWAVDEVQRRLVLLANHVIQQEPEAVARLARMKGRVALFQWRDYSFRVRFTPAGLLDLAPAGTPGDLTVAITQESPVALVQGLVSGSRPAVRIEGDVQLAAEINWLVDHLRWDVEEDVSRLIGDAPAHALGQAARAAFDALRGWLKAAGARLRPGAAE
jgi:ubiquinone biosynthesis protein UbiJ